MKWGFALTFCGYTTADTLAVEFNTGHWVPPEKDGLHPLSYQSWIPPKGLRVLLELRAPVRISKGCDTISPWSKSLSKATSYQATANHARFIRPTHCSRSR